VSDLTEYPYPGVEAGHADFIPEGRIGSCPAAAAYGYLCTLDKGHDGDHAAHGLRENMVARWSA
jgi:hypothetical protein